MKLLKRMAVLTLVVLALGGCTKSSITDEAPVIDGEVDSAKLDNGDDDETLPRDQNIIVEENPEVMPLYDWDQVKYDTDDVFSDVDTYPQAVKLEFTANEDTMTIDMNWILKDGTSSDEAKVYASDLVKRFNDIVAVQSMDLEESSASSFGTLWNSFALNLKITTEDGSVLLDKSYQAGGKIDLENFTEEEGPGPEIVEENVPKKLDETKAN